MVLVFGETYRIFCSRQLDEEVDLGKNKATGRYRGPIGTFEGHRVHPDGAKFKGYDTPAIFPQGFTQMVIDVDSTDEIVSEVRVSCVCIAMHVLISFSL
jgi:hypothetical protein